MSFLENLSKSKNQDFYGSRQKYTEIETLGKVKKKAISIDGNIQHKFIDLMIIILLSLPPKLTHLIMIQWMLLKKQLTNL